MARSRSSRCQGARGHRVGASGSVLAQRGPQPAPQPGSAWLGARRAARSEQAGASAAAWRPPGPLPGHQKILATQGLCRTQASERFLPEKLPAWSKKRQEEEEEAERGGLGPTNLHLAGIVPAPAHGAGTGLVPPRGSRVGVRAAGCGRLQAVIRLCSVPGLFRARLQPRAPQDGSCCKGRSSAPPKTPCRGDLCKVAAPALARRNTRRGWRGCRIAGGSGLQRVHNGKCERGEGSAAEKPHKHPAGATGAISTAQALRPPRPCHQAGPGPLPTAPFWGFGGTAWGSGVTAVPGGRRARGLGRPPGGPQSTQGPQGMQGSRGVQGDPKACMGIPKHTGGH